MTAQSSILAWKNSMHRGAGGQQCMGLQSDKTEHSSEAEAYFCKSVTFSSFFKAHTYYQLA